MCGALACALMMVTVLALPATASAAVELTALHAKPIAPTTKCTSLQEMPAVTQAGAAQDFCFAMALDGGADPELGDRPGLGDDLRRLSLTLPLGTAPDVQATPRCAVEVFLSDKGCPATSQVGQMSMAVDAFGAGRIDERLLQGKIYNLVPQGTEGSRLGMSVNVKIGSLSLDGVIHIQTETRLLPSTSALQSVTAIDAPRSLRGIPIELRRFNIHLWGSKDDHPSLERPYFRLPTTCTPAVTTVSTRSYADEVRTAESTYTPTGCDKLENTNTLIFESARRADEPGFMTVGLRVPEPANGLASPHNRKTTLVLPRGYEVSPTVANRPGFTGCTDAQFGKGEYGQPTCPPESQLGTVLMSSPLLQKDFIEGRVYLAMPPPGTSDIRFFVVAEAGPERDASRVKVVVHVEINPETGQLTSVLDGLPPTPYTEFRYTFFDGPNSNTKMPRSCGSYTARARVEPHNGGAPKLIEASTDIDQGCHETEPFTPTFTASTASPFAGQWTEMTTVFTRPSGTARMRSIDMNLPKGLSGRLTASAVCPAAVAATGSCGEDSRVGRVHLLLGGGPDPKPLAGNVYLTEGLDGALAGLNIVVDATIGPLYLGRVISQGWIFVQPDTSLRLVVPEIPLRQRGVDSNVRQMQVTFDRAGFNRNASSCAPHEFTGVVTSDTGIAVPISAPYQATGCDTLRYEPDVRATIYGGRGATKDGGHPSLKVQVSQTSGEGSSRRMEVTLPEGLSPDSTRLRSVCELADFDRDACPPESIKGEATAYSPLLPEPLRGPVTFVRVPGEALPGLRISLRGKISLTLSGRISFGERGRVVNTLDPIPDTPLSRFELDLKSGPDSTLIATRDFCQGRPTVDSFGTSHSGKEARGTTPVEVEGCEPAGTVRLSSLRGGRPSLDLRVAGGRTRVTTTRLVLPKGMEFQRSTLVRKRLRVSAAGLRRGAKARVTVTGSSITVSVPKGQSATVLRARLSKGAVRVSSRLRRQGRPRLTFRLTSRTSDNRTARAGLRVRPGGR
jgi:hypothetical protein